MRDAISCHNRVCQSHCVRRRGLLRSQRQGDILSVDDNLWWHRSTLLLAESAAILVPFGCRTKPALFSSPFLSLIWPQEVQRAALGRGEPRARHHPSLMGPTKPGLLPVLHRAHCYAFIALKKQGQRGAVWIAIWADLPGSQVSCGREQSGVFLLCCSVWVGCWIFEL